ncbi:MAG: HAMP domain-containing protein [Bacteroidetes bacterium]|nr:HAMP domain-containing protein [Bacteroidota bacterium]
MKLPALKLSSKLRLSFVFIGCVSIFITGWLAYENARTALEEVTFQRLTAIREARRQQIEHYFERIRNDVVAYSNDQLIIGAARALRASFLPLARKKFDREDYAAFIAAEDAITNGQRSAVGAANGARAKLLNAHIRVMHAFDKDIVGHLEQQGYYDIFLVDARGDIVYTARREADFGSNLIHGPNRASNIATVFRAARDATDRQFARFVDFEPYEPSGDAPSSFVASPVFDADHMIAVLIVQISIDDINTMMTEGGDRRDGVLGRSGETYIVGTDYRMRNDSRFFIEEPEAYLRTLEHVGTDGGIIDGIRQYQTSVLLQEVRTEATDAALRGITDTRNVVDYRGEHVLSSFTPLDIPDLHWVMLSEIDENEAFASVHALRRQLLYSGLVILLIAIGLGVVMSLTITRPIRTLTAATEGFGRGDFDKRANVRVRDEIGDLAQTFNTMADKIRSHTGRLEEEVRERRYAEEELIRSQEQFRNLSRHLQTVREEERKGVAREIHDELGQNLTTLKLHLSLLLEDLPPSDTALREKFVTIITDIDTTIQSVKRIISSLRPGLLDDLGLVAAIEWQAEEFQRRTGIFCALHIDPPDISLDADRSTAVFRIFQETLTNVARHAAATRVTIKLLAGNRGISLHVHDDGRGISADSIRDPRSFGLLGIRERAHYWNGTVTFEGVPGRGTNVDVTIPFDHDGAA